MNEKNVLPVDFDGIFRFTNWTDNEFKARWNNLEYAFPAQHMVPMIIPNSTPEEVQYIRKKFAKELAIREFYATDRFKNMENVPPGGVPALYTEKDLTPFIQKCLEPLPIAKAEIKALPKDTEDRYRKNTKGKNVTKVLDGDESLLAQASGPAEE